MKKRYKVAKRNSTVNGDPGRHYDCRLYGKPCDYLRGRQREADMHVVCILQKWDAFEVTPNAPFPITITTDKMIGFLPVYATREDAMEDYLDAKVLEIRLRDE